MCCVSHTINKFIYCVKNIFLPVESLKSNLFISGIFWHSSFTAARQWNQQIFIYMGELNALKNNCLCQWFWQSQESDDKAVHLVLVTNLADNMHWPAGLLRPSSLLGVSPWTSSKIAGSFVIMDWPSDWVLSLLWNKQQQCEKWLFIAINNYRVNSGHLQICQWWIIWLSNDAFD